MKVSVFKKWLASCFDKNIILVNGTEEYFKIVTREYVLSEMKDVDYSSFTADEVTREKAVEIVSDSDTIPFLSARKVFFLRDIDRVSPGAESILCEHFERVPEYSVFVLTATSLDKRGKLYKRISGKGAVLPAKSPYANECAEWIQFLLIESGKTMEREAAGLFVELVGTSLATIRNELTKVALFIKDKKLISVEDVLQITNSIKLNSIFELTDAIGTGDSVKALFLLENMIDQGTHEIVVVTMIARHFRQLIRIQDMKKRGAGRGEIVSKLRIHPFFADGYIRQAMDMSPERTLRFFKRVCLSDVAMKSLNWDARQLTESLILSR